jgi:hypothetical protein
MSTERRTRDRTAAAYICLLAVALLYAPLGAAAWPKRTMDCCAGGFCPMAAHHHHDREVAGTGNSSPMNCGHDMDGKEGRGGEMWCSMRCCQNSSRAALVPGAFLLPAENLALVSDTLAQPVQIGNSLKLSGFIQPLSPPPRFAA